jgi:hypothetical protein
MARDLTRRRENDCCVTVPERRRMGCSGALVGALTLGMPTLGEMDLDAAKTTVSAENVEISVVYFGACVIERDTRIHVAELCPELPRRPVAKPSLAGVRA